MKSISNYDFSLLLEKLPVVMQYARAGIPHSDVKAVNALRVLTILQKKLEISHKKNKSPIKYDDRT